MWPLWGRSTRGHRLSACVWPLYKGTPPVRMRDKHHGKLCWIPSTIHEYNPVYRQRSPANNSQPCFRCTNFFIIKTTFPEWPAVGLLGRYPHAPPIAVKRHNLGNIISLWRLAGHEVFQNTTVLSATQTLYKVMCVSTESNMVCVSYPVSAGTGSLSDRSVVATMDAQEVDVCVNIPPFIKKRNLAWNFVKMWVVMV